MRPSIPCAVCLDLNPTHFRTTRWQVNVTGNLLIEYVLPFTISELETSSQGCAFCAVVKNGIELISGDAFRDDREGLSGRRGSFIVQKDLPCEVEIFGEDGNVRKSRMQFYMQEGERSGQNDMKWCLQLNWSQKLQPEMGCLRDGQASRTLSFSRVSFFTHPFLDRTLSPNTHYLWPRPGRCASNASS